MNNNMKLNEYENKINTYTPSELIKEEYNIFNTKQCDNIIRRFEEAKDQQEDTFLEGHRHFTEITISHVAHRTCRDVVN